MNCYGDQQKLNIGYKSDIGLKRMKNEDSLYFDQQASFFILADGMGGYNKGEVASKIAVDTIAKSLKTYLHQKSSLSGSLEEYHPIINSINIAHDNIRKKAECNNKYQGMGTTIAIAISITDRNILIGNVGDSRIYLIKHNKSKLFQLSEDHTKLSRLIKEGKASLDKNTYSKYGHILTKCLGRSASIIDPFVKKYAWDNEDCLLLCTDGLTSMLTDEEIMAIYLNSNHTNPNSSQLLCNKLVDESIKRGGLDNITVIVVQNNTLQFRS